MVPVRARLSVYPPAQLHHHHLVACLQTSFYTRVPRAFRVLTVLAIRMCLKDYFTIIYYFIYKLF